MTSSTKTYPPRSKSNWLRVLSRFALCSTLILALSVALKTRSRLSLLLPSFSHHPAVMSYQQERYIAELAVQRACLLTQKVFFEKAKGTVSKDDKSPVTIGDFGAQALIIQAIRKNFPNDEIVGEEEASSLRQDKGLSAEIWRLVKDIKLDDAESDKVLGGPLPSEESMLDIIDQGNSPGGPKGRIWALDPIDGTKGFLRGGQYAVCLGLIVDGDVKVGAIGTPNLPVDNNATIDASTGANQGGSSANGVLFSAVEGEGATSRPLSTGTLAQSKPISMRPVANIAMLSSVRVLRLPTPPRVTTPLLPSFSASPPLASDWTRRPSTARSLVAQVTSTSVFPSRRTTRRRSGTTLPVTSLSARLVAR